jgi:hypothetical protein
VDGDAGLGDLPGGFGTGEAGAEDNNGCAHLFIVSAGEGRVEKKGGQSGPSPAVAYAMAGKPGVVGR